MLRARFLYYIMKSLIRNSIIVLAILAVVTGNAPCQQGDANSVTPEMRAAANEAYQKRDWAAAAAGIQRIVDVEPKNAGSRYRLGVALTMELYEVLFSFRSFS